MLHQIEILIYVILSITLIFKGTQRPIWAVGFYMLNFFAQPDYWEWGIPLRNPGVLRWSLYSALFLLTVVVMQPSRTRFRPNPLGKRALSFLILMLINGVIVHFAFAYHPDISWETYVEMFKFAVLFPLILAAIRNTYDFKLLLAFFTIGLGYWGFEARFVGVTLINGRLEQFGGPGCANSNELASITATLLPPIGGLLFMIRGVRRVLGALAAGLALNILMLCNSRGGFIGLMAGAFTLPVLTTGKARKIALNGLALGALAVFLLAGNPQILARFVTTFISDAAESDSLDEHNKMTRKIFWLSAIDMIKDNPLGSGGKAFMAGKGNPYIDARGLDTRNRSCHQGYLEEAMSWGVLGLVFRLGFMVCSGLAALRASRFRSKIGDAQTAFVGVCVIAGFSVVLVTSMFGDFLQMEWGFWICIASVAYAKVYGEETYGQIPDAMLENQKASASRPPQQPNTVIAGVS